MSEPVNSVTMKVLQPLWNESSPRTNNYCLAYSNYSYSWIGPKERALNLKSLRRRSLFLLPWPCMVHMQLNPTWREGLGKKKWGGGGKGKGINIFFDNFSLETASRLFFRSRPRDILLAVRSGRSTSKPPYQENRWRSQRANVCPAHSRYWWRPPGMLSRAERFSCALYCHVVGVETCLMW